MIFTKISIERPVATIMIFLVFVIFGYISFSGLNISQPQAAKSHVLTIHTTLERASPSEIENLISKKIEGAVSTVSKIISVESYSKESVSVVRIEFENSQNIDESAKEVKQKLDEIKGILPKGTSNPIVKKSDIQPETVIDLILSGNENTSRLYEYANNLLKEKFSAIEGVESVNISGEESCEIKITFDDRAVFENVISLPQLADWLNEQSKTTPLGSFSTQGSEYSIRMNGEFKNLNDLSNLMIPTPFGSKKLSQVADIKYGSKSTANRTVFYNNKSKLKSDNAVRISLIKSAEANDFKISEEFNKILSEINSSLPKDTELIVINNNTESEKENFDDFLRNILLGILLAVVILLIFMSDYSGSLTVILSVSALLLTSFLFLKLSVFSINIMSVTGIIIALILHLSNSVIITESIIREKRGGVVCRIAAHSGTNDAALTVISSSLALITILFLFLYFSPFVGEYFREAAQTAIFISLFSIVLSFTLTPVLSTLLIPDYAGNGKFALAIQQFEDRQKEIYTAILRKVLKNNWTASGILAITLFISLLLIFIYKPDFSTGFTNKNHSGMISIQVRLPEGNDLKETAFVTKVIETRIIKYDAIENIITNSGQYNGLYSGSNLANMEIYLKDSHKGSESIKDYISKISRDLSDIPNAEIKITSEELKTPVKFELLARNPEKIDSIKKEIIRKLKKVSGIANFENSYITGKPEISIVPFREKLSELGVTVSDISETIQAAIQGFSVTGLNENGNDYNISLSMNENSVNSPEKIANIPIVTPKGSFRLSQLCRLKFTKSSSVIQRKNNNFVIKFTVYPKENVSNDELISEIKNIIEGDDSDGKQTGIKMPAGYRIVWSDVSGSSSQISKEICNIFLLSILLFYILLAAIFEDFRQPLSVLLCLLSVFAVLFLILNFTETEMGLSAILGLILIIVITVNNSILLQKNINLKIREKGISAKEAILISAPLQIKSVMIANLAVILFLLPIASGANNTAASFGYVIIAGLLISSFITHFIFPAAMYVNESFSGFFKRKSNPGLFEE